MCSVKGEHRWSRTDRLHLQRKSQLYHNIDLRQNYQSINKIKPKNETVKMSLTSLLENMYIYGFFIHYHF